MSFTDQKQRIATKEDINLPWNGVKNGKRFRCFLCGHKFKVGDKWRWVFSKKYDCINLIVCNTCDTNDTEDICNKFKKIRDSFSWIWSDK